MSETRLAEQSELTGVFPGRESSGVQERVSLAEAAAQALASLTRPDQPTGRPGPASGGAVTVNSALRVLYAADFYRRYPGEDVTFFARVEVAQPVAGFVLRVELPIGVRLVRASDAPQGVAPDLTVAREQVESSTGARRIERRTLVWYVEKTTVGAAYDFEACMTVPPVKELWLEDSPSWPGADYWLVSTARAEPFLPTGVDQAGAVQATAAVAVFPKSRYLQYLPALYERDEFMGRFLMLFESFWAPIEMQASGIDDYFNPRMAPMEMTRWMAERFNLAWYPDLPEENRRNLLSSAVHLYRKRGTRQGLQELLEILTRSAVEIVEHRAENFSIGPEARLGHGIALGSANQPHTFVVRLRLPPVPETVGGKAVSPEEQERLERVRREQIRAIIDAEKPAHVTYSLDFNSAK